MNAILNLILSEHNPEHCRCSLIFSERHNYYTMSFNLDFHNETIAKSIRPAWWSQMNIVQVWLWMAKRVILYCAVH